MLGGTTYTKSSSYQAEHSDPIPMVHPFIMLMCIGTALHRGGVQLPLERVWQLCLVTQIFVYAHLYVYIVYFNF